MAYPKLDTSPERSAQMSRIRSTNTKPEMLVRNMLHRLGFRYRLHVPNLPGRPDIVLPKYGLVIQVKGCFWHGHSCSNGRTPKYNVEYWVPKLKRNRERDRSNEQKLRRLGWSVHTIWECHIKQCERDDFESMIMNIVVGKNFEPSRNLLEAHTGPKTYRH